MINPAYRVEINNATPVHMAWKAEDYGKPSGLNLVKFVIAYNDSFLPGGVNEHISKAGLIVEAKIVHQLTGKVKATFTQ